MSFLDKGVALVFCSERAVEEGVPLVLRELDTSGRHIGQISILDCASIDFELLSLVVPEKYVSAVNYAQCFDLKGVLQSLDSEMKDETLIVIIGLKQLLDRDKLSDFAMTHKLLNDAMLQVRKYTSDGGGVVLLENEGECSSVVDYYVDVRYQLKSGSLMPV